MYLLDTNVLSELLRREPSPVVAEKFEATTDEELFTSVICVEEVAFGAAIAPEGNRIWERFENKVLARVSVLELDLNSALLSGAMRGEWHKQGTSVGYPDALIAATAKAYGITLVTRNVRHFDHVTGLRVENWFDVRA